jgi:phospholipid-binding lipoprotein MlaA
MTTSKSMKSPLWLAAAALGLALLQGCATGPGSNPADPLEPYNRTIFKFNEGLDRALVKPAATVYRDVTPALLRRGVTNFFGNIADVRSFINNVLQLKGEDAADTFFRVTTNTFWGLGGIFDVASDLQIARHSQDFGRTLGYWGVAPGPYVVLPVLGPSTVRDSAGLFVDSKVDLVGQVEDIPVRNVMISGRAVNLRANLLGVGDVLEQAALDKYSFAREIYLRRHLQRSRSFNILGPDNDESPAPAPAAEERFDLPEVVPQAAPGAGAVNEPAAPAQ